MNKKATGPCLRITMKELISSMMVAEDRTEIRKGEIYDRYLEITYKMKQKNINGVVLYSREHLDVFKYENDNEFDVGVKTISLKDGYTIDWLYQTVVSHIPNKKLQILGLIEQENLQAF